MPVIHLVRHGQASAAADTTEGYDVLSGLGRRQAEAVGAELARRAPRDPRIVCGTLNRQRDTAELLAKAAGIGGQVRTDPRWNEYDHLALLRRYGGAFPGGPAPADGRGVQALLDHVLTAWIGDADGGWPDFSGGALAALRELAAELEPGRDAVVVTSGGVLAALCGALLSAPPAGVVALNRVTVNAAVTTVTAGSAGLSLLSFNDHAHFAGERRALLTHR
ncbi:histidine phosphatase family protein [Streptomyces carminius]|uniref:Histidine phosphatase family protein n=1 Tax=Streptomyces carminius TaxID=2665496 RepID=A0A2M8LTW4_9ACTN|nr:histidine phosphatase family protein [Streptomyces carminius]PJE95401.1 histidine phosphatase family protein [Streptomyces carminius]